MGAHLLSIILAATLAGYCAAWIAGRAPLVHGALTAWPLAGFLVGALLVQQEQASAWRAFVGLGLGVSGGIAGGWLLKRQMAGNNR